MKQKHIFKDDEGDAWFTRNLGSLGNYDPVTAIIDELLIKPKYVLEVGCANGWRLDKLRTKFDCGVVGIEPSMKACIDGAQRGVTIHQMSANNLPVTPGGYDMIIYGFCLYLTDPEDWLNIAAEGDRALADGGHLIIHDFNAEMFAPFAKHYDHRPGVLAYHFDFARLWLAHPRYVAKASRTGPHDDSIVVLRKRSLKEAIKVIP